MVKHISIYTIIFLFISTLFYNYKIGFSCSWSEELIKNIEWNSMEPLIKNGNNKTIMLDYYNTCNKQVQIWDIIGYNYAGSKKLLMKQVKVDNSIKIEWQNKKLLLNWEVFVNSIWKEYIFSQKQKNLLNLYITNNYITKDSYFIFWDNVENSIDSRNFWAISQKDIIGKFK